MGEGRLLRIDLLRSAAADFVSAALVGQDWEAAIQRIAVAAGASGGALLRNRDYRVVGVISTPEIREPVATFLAGKIPPPSRQKRLLTRIGTEFRFDHDDYSDEELARDPYYQEFLRPIGYFWHAAAELDREGGGDDVALSLKRRLTSGPYQRNDAGLLNQILPELRAGVRIARSVMDAEGSGVARLMQRRGAPVFELDAWGRVLRSHVFTDETPRPVRIVRGRLVAQDRLAQPALDRAIALGIAPEGAPATAPLPDVEGNRHFLQVVPVGGRARDVFLAAAAVAVLIRRKPRLKPVLVDPFVFRDAFAMTDREAEVAHLLGEGLSPADIAQQLRIQLHTTRDHLKSIFAKTGTGRQAELVALIGQLRL